MNRMKWELLQAKMALLLKRPEYVTSDGERKRANSIFDTQAKKLYIAEEGDGRFPHGVELSPNKYMELMQTGSSSWVIDSEGSLCRVTCIEDVENNGFQFNEITRFPKPQVTDNLADHLSNAVREIAISFVERLHAQESIGIQLLCMA